VIYSTVCRVSSYYDAGYSRNGGEAALSRGLRSARVRSETSSTEYPRRICPCKAGIPPVPALRNRISFIWLIQWGITRRGGETSSDAAFPIAVHGPPPPPPSLSQEQRDSMPGGRAGPPGPSPDAITISRAASRCDARGTHVFTRLGRAAPSASTPSSCRLEDRGPLPTSALAFSRSSSCPPPRRCSTRLRPFSPWMCGVACGPGHRSANWFWSDARWYAHPSQGGSRTSPKLRGGKHRW